MTSVVALAQRARRADGHLEWTALPESEWDTGHLAAAKRVWEDAVAIDGELPPLAGKIARLFIGTYWNSNTGRCDPSVQTLCDLVEATERPVQLALGALVRRGYLEVEECRGRPSNYRPVFVPRETVREKARRIRQERESRGEVAAGRARRRRWEVARGIERSIGRGRDAEINGGTPVEIDGGGALKSTGEGRRKQRPNPLVPLESITPLPPQGEWEGDESRGLGRADAAPSQPEEIDALLGTMHRAKGCKRHWWLPKVTVWVGRHGIGRVREVVLSELGQPGMTRELLEDAVERQLAFTRSVARATDLTPEKLARNVEQFAGEYAAQSGLSRHVIAEIVERAVSAEVAAGSAMPRADGWARVRDTYWGARKNPGRWGQLLAALGMSAAPAVRRAIGGLSIGVVVPAIARAAADSAVDENESEGRLDDGDEEAF